MFSIKCDECENKAQKCNWCQGKPYQCFVCNRVITYRDKHYRLLEHFNNTDQYLTCRKCKVYKHISQYRFKQCYCRLCTEERFRRWKPSETWKPSEAWEPSEAWKPSKAWKPSEASNCIIIINLQNSPISINS